MSLPDTFDFFGFTHICGKTRAGGFLLHRHTSMSRMRARLVALRDELRRRRHLPVADQGKWLRDVVRGYFAYHAVPSNIERLDAFRTEVAKHWHKALRRRSQRDRTTWVRTARLVERWLPHARILHPYPWDRFSSEAFPKAARSSRPSCGGRLARRTRIQVTCCSRAP
jgi:RNA-directed DNA polymerase